MSFSGIEIPISFSGKYCVLFPVFHSNHSNGVGAYSMKSNKIATYLFISYKYINLNMQYLSTCQSRHKCFALVISKLSLTLV